MDCIRPFIGIITSLWPSCVTHANYLYKLQENGDSLEKALNELRNARDDVQKKVDDAEANLNEPMKRNDQVIRWFQSVTATEGEVLEILRQVDQETSRRCLGGCCSNCWNDYMLGSSIVQKIASLDGLREKGRFDEVADKLPPPSVQEEPTSAIVGKSMFDKVWRLLVEDEVRIMGLYGYGGVGKTTLLKQINNEFFKSTTTTTTHVFDVVILVVVSEVINIDAIQKKIGNRLGLSSSDRRSIFNALTKKRFVLLLDDIWKTIDLQSIGVPPLENNKSKVIFTTRSETVCGHMDANIKFRVECLPWDEAWALFQKKVGNETLNSHPDVPELAKIVAKECGGLPLPLITIGRAMSSKKIVREWNHAITILRKSASDFPGMSEEVLPILKRSYDGLHKDTFKSCFLYCALFPEDDFIDNAKLIDYWIGEGFISLSDEFNNLVDARNKGYGVIGDLKGASLLESGEDEKTEVKMHDTIRDLALWIAHDCGSSKRDKMCIIDTSDLTPERSSSLYNNAERIYLITPPHYAHYSATEEVRSPPSPLKSPNLITLIHQGFFSVLPQNFFEFTPLLRVLDLSHNDMETFPISITELLELRYLSLSCTGIEELPQELGKLVKLNYLDLSNMWNLMTIPPGVIGSLLELRVLNLYGSYKAVDWDFDAVYKLKHLNDLGITINTQHKLNKLLSNQNLQMCTRHLILDNFLLFVLQPQSTSLSSSIITIEKLQLLFNLETLQLRCIPMGIEQQQHLGFSCFQNLGEIVILGCNGLKDLTWVGYVPNLKTLFVGYCDELEEIVILVDDFGGSTEGGGGDETILTKLRKIDIFKSLKTLRLWGLSKLKSICRNALAFPCLELMAVDECPRLKRLPFDSGSNPNNTLQKIQGERKWWTELQWEDETIKSKFLPYQVQQKAGSMLEKVGNETLNSHPDVPELAKIVARECGGLPLPLITIGRAMSSKKTVREWNHAITILRKSASAFPGLSEEVLPILKQIYDGLHNDTFKSCFLYCAIFPKDHSIKKSKLIDYWIGEGFISLREFNNLDDARNKGYDVIGDLKGACLLESGRDEKTQVKMHDTIRDLALWIVHDRESKRDKMLIIKTSDLTAERSSWYNNAERIFLIPPPPPDDGKTKVRPPSGPPSPLKSPNLITLIRHRFCDLSLLPQNFFEFTPLLRVLDLSNIRMKTFPISITELLELQYLSLSSTGIQALPEELGNLVKLNFLDLSNMWNLMTIPPGVIGSLLELRVLNLYNCYIVDWDIEEVDQLKHLNDLGITINTQHNLNKLLSNQNLERIPEANMVMGIEQQQQHLGSSCFQNLIQIFIFNCNGLKELTWVGYVPNLKTLDVVSCDELEEIVMLVDDDLGGSKGGGGGNELIFKSLETLHLNSLPKLKSICSHALAFPCLESLSVSHCPQLKKLPFDSGSNVNNTLRDIQGGPRWWSELQWEEEYHNNNNNELLKSKFLPYFEEHSIYD